MSKFILSYEVLCMLNFSYPEIKIEEIIILYRKFNVLSI